jgi:3-hydroxyisobutyrate dehydrogenase-like beta-hydroxyacid dehydrogenase
MNLASESSREFALDLQGLETALGQYKKLAERGGGENGTQGLYELYDKK